MKGEPMNTTKTLYRCTQCGVMSETETCTDCGEDLIEKGLLLQMVHVRTGANPPLGSEHLPPEWLQLIWETNRVAAEGQEKEVFGKPRIDEWWAGGTVEEYPNARVIHRGDGTVSVVSKTQRGAEMITLAAGRLELQTNPVISEIGGA
jgi:hypothetical protein